MENDRDHLETRDHPAGGRDHPGQNPHITLSPPGVQPQAAIFSFIDLRSQRLGSSLSEKQEIEGRILEVRGGRAKERGQNLPKCSTLILS
jgi:hypothetical protein